MVAVNMQRGYGPSESEFTLYTNRNVLDSDEFLRQRTRAQELFDAVAGNWNTFHQPRERTISFSTVDTGNSQIVSPELDSDKDDYYNFVELRIVQGTGSGEKYFISDYDGSSKLVTLTGTASLSADTDSIVIFRQIATFPRFEDMDVDGRPVYHEALPRIISYIIEHFIVIGAQEALNADGTVSDKSGKLSESSPDWSVTYKDSRNPSVEMIGWKAWTEAQRNGLIRGSARLTRFDPRAFEAAIAGQFDIRRKR